MKARRGTDRQTSEFRSRFGESDGIESTKRKKESKKGGHKRIKVNNVMESQKEIKRRWRW